MQTSYLSLTSLTRLVEKKLPCGEIAAVHAWRLWRNLKYLHVLSNFKFLHMRDVEIPKIYPHVEKFQISPHCRSQHVACVWCKNVNTNAKFMLFFIKSVFFCNLRNFVAKSVVSWFTHFCVEKNLSKNCISGDKMTNMRSVPTNTIF